MKIFLYVTAFFLFFVPRYTCVDMARTPAGIAQVCDDDASWRAGDVVSEGLLKSLPPDSFFLVSDIPDGVFLRMRGKSFPDNCTVSRQSLRYLRVIHYDFEGKVRRGELVCNVQIAADLRKIFMDLFKNRYPIESIRLIDDFDADDERSMRANNTSCFCFRRVAGSKKLSRHSLGLAVDVNPRLNPCVRNDARGRRIVQPSNGGEYVDRKRAFRGKITTEDFCYKLFSRAGFRWGGSWRTLKDYQHFEK